MNKQSIKAIAKLVVPVMLALGAAYGYVDSSCTCDAPVTAPAAE